MAQGVWLRGALDVGALECALGALVDRHEVLRTRLVEGLSGPEQRIDGPGTGFALARLAAGSRDEALAAARAFAGSGFDLSREWPLRGCVIGLGSEDHVLVLVLHHVAGDGWSVGILARELAALYGAAVTGVAARLPGLAVQYADYAAWQRDWLGSGVEDRELAYWRGALAGAPGLLRLPWDGPRATVSRHRGGVVEIGFDAALIGGLKGLCRAEGVTLFMALLAGFGLVLGRWSGQREVVIGTPVANRLRPELEGVVGFFVNTLALRLGLGGMPSGSALLARARQVALGGYDHQAVPFERVVEALHPERSLGHSPLFQAMLALQGSERELVPGLGLAGVSGEALDLGSLGSKFDVTLSLAATAEGGLTGSLEYDSDLFGAATMARLGAQLAAALRGLAQAPARPLWRLELVDASPARIGPRPVRRGGGGDAASVVSLVEAQVLLRPGSVAVEGGGEGLSYGALWSRSGTLAARLRGLGVGPDRVVGLCLDRAVGTVVSVLAVWRAGGAYVALDPTYPDARLDYLIRDSGAVAVLSRGGDAARIEGLLAADPGSRRVAVLDLDRFDDNDAGPLSALPDPPHPDALAYVIYTSGSTGQPKPVAVSHFSIRNKIITLGEKFGIGSGFRSAWLAPLAFDRRLNRSRYLFAMAAP